MKKILLTLLAIFNVYFSYCQEVSQEQPQELTYLSDSPSAILYTLPRTSVKVRVVVEQTTIKKGLYSRFAQKYLGISVALADKEIYTIKGASICAFTESDPSEIYTINASKSVLSNLVKQRGNLLMPISEAVTRDRFSSEIIDDEFTFTDVGISPLWENTQEDLTDNLPAERTSQEFKGLEQMAKEAAEAIFTIRKRRFELITGETSEDVFGQGLGAAIEEMSRLEKKYIELFTGKQSVNQIVREYELLPQKDKFSYIVCRFSESKGLVSLNDLSARPIVLDMTLEQFDPIINLPRLETPVNPKEVLVHELFKYKVAKVAQCSLVDGANTLVTNRLPIYQFGYVVDIPVNIEIRK